MFLSTLRPLQQLIHGVSSIDLKSVMGDDSKSPEKQKIVPMTIAEVTAQSSTDTESVVSVKQKVKVPFDAGIRVEPPVSYQMPVKVVPTPIDEFVIDEQKNEAKVNLEIVRRSHQQIKSKEAPRPTLKDLKIRQLPNGAFKALIIAGDTDTKIFAICEECEDVGAYLKYIESSIADFIAKSDTLNEYKPTKDEIILAKFEGVYYRAVCKSADKESCLVYFRKYNNLISFGEFIQNNFFYSQLNTETALRFRKKTFSSWTRS